MASNSKKLGELFGGTDDVKTEVLDNVDPSFVSDKNNTSTGYFDLPNGTTAQRPTAASGMIRYNSSTGLAEYHDGSLWKSIDAPPQLTSISPSSIADSDSSVDITITGTNFTLGGQTVKAIGQDNSEITAGTVVRDSATQLTATFDGTDFDDAQEDYSITVTNTASSLTATLSDALAVNASPAWTEASGTIGTIYESTKDSVSITTGASDDEGDSLTYSVSVGSLPTGLSIDSSTGTISGSTSSVGSDTTTTFTLSVTDGTNTSTRQYSIVQKAPVVTSYTSVGSGTFSVPSGVTAVDVLVVGGGGSGGAGGGGYGSGGGGGAGGLIYRPAFPVTPGGSVSYSVGGGAAGPSTGPAAPYQGNPEVGSDGSNSTFGGLTAIGGGGGGAHATGRPGGSGGGAGGNNDPSFGGTGTQPQQPGDSSTYGFGNPGGESGSQFGAGGGGAAQRGQDAGPSANGGNGKQYGISGSQVYYAGGGGGGEHGPSGSGGSSRAGGQGGGGTGGNGPTSSPGGNGTANRGGGGGGGGENPGGSGTAGRGGSGIVIISY